MSLTTVLHIAIWASIIMLIVENIDSAKEIGRLKREVMRNRDDIIYLQKLSGQQIPWHGHIDWEKEYPLSHK